MNCLECRELLQKRLDGEPIAAQTLEPHLSQCAACREQHIAAQQMLDALHHQPQPSLPVHFAKTMASEVLKDRQQRQNQTRRRVIVTMALAASVLVMLMLAYYWIPRAENNDSNRKAPIVDNPPKIDAPKIVEKPKDVERKSEPRHAFTAFTDRLADTTRDHAKVVLAAANLDAMDKLPVSDLPMNPSVGETGQEVSEGVRSVTRNARKALDFFARELPMTEIGADKN